jgi:exonuclease VII large subunit
MASSDPFTPAALNDLMAQRLAAIADRVGREKGMIAVKGRLPKIPEPWLNDVIYADLVDPVLPTQIVGLAVRPSTMREAEVQAGDTVIAYGSIVTNLSKGQLKLRLRVDRVEVAEPPKERERREAELTALQAVRLAGGVRHHFPSKPSPRIALLCSKTSAVKEDFLNALGSLRHELWINEVPVSMASPEHVASAISSVQEEVMVLIRGGGHDIDFGVNGYPLRPS